MNGNIYKVLIILVCFAFVLVVALTVPQKDTQETGRLEEQSTILVPKEEVSKVEPAEEIVLEHNPELRILITTSDFRGSIHEEVRVTSSRDFRIKGEDGTLFAEYGAWEEIDLDIFQMQPGECLIFESDEKISLPSVKRAQGVPEYYGTLQIYKEDEGYSIINVVPMEQYLLSVVPSEMPSTYPMEALKAQAVCARSYAYHYVVNLPELPHGAHMNDSTDYQVYNNIEETENTNTAIAETEGMILVKEGLPIPTYFFSTSCGYTTNETIWKKYFNGTEPEDGEIPTVVFDIGTTEAKEDVNFPSVPVIGNSAIETLQMDDKTFVYSAEELAGEDKFSDYITKIDENSLEMQEQWYRWTYTGIITRELIEKKLQERYAVRPDLILTQTEEGYFTNQEIETIGDIIGIEIMKRLDGGVADELILETTKDTYLVIGEYNIRYVLSDEKSEVTRNDGSKVTVPYLLPSAYFIMEPISSANGVVKKITLTGGGYGHGVGMSQNGAKCAADIGMKCEEILELFYTELQIMTISA